MKSFLILLFGLLALTFSTQARPAVGSSRYAPVLQWVRISNCCYFWAVTDDATGTVLGKGVYCAPDCDENTGPMVRTGQPASYPAPEGALKTALEAQLRQVAQAALPGITIEKMVYNPAASPMHVVPGLKVDDISQLPAEVAKYLAAQHSENATPRTPGACRLKECSLFPNPVGDVLTLKFNYDCSAGGIVSKAATITATSMATGKQTVLWTGKLTQENNEVAIPAAGLPAGLYQVRVQVGVFDKTYEIQKL